MMPQSQQINERGIMVQEMSTCNSAIIRILDTYRPRCRKCGSRIVLDDLSGRRNLYCACSSAYLPLPYTDLGIGFQLIYENYWNALKWVKNALRECEHNKVFYVSDYVICTECGKWLDNPNKMLDKPAEKV